jgi:hypothetical protein
MLCVGFVKRSQHPTVLEITQFDDAMQPQSQPILEECNWLATLGFSSARCVLRVHSLFVYTATVANGIVVFAVLV